MFQQVGILKSKLCMVNYLFASGEPLNEEVIYNWEEATGLVIKEGYGQTETTLLLGTFKVKSL